MRKSNQLVALAAAGLAGMISVQKASATLITQWTFGTVNTGPDNSPAPDFGPGVASSLGMTNTYLETSGSTITGTGTFTGGTTLFTSATTFDDVLATAGDPNGYPNAWRVRGAGQTGMANGNGWALQAPQYTQGAEFDSSTVGYTNIGFSFDWYSTTQGVKDMQPEYTLDGSTWNLFGPLLIATSNNFNSSSISLDFSSIPGAANDPTFGVRLVSAYDPTLSPTNYGSANGGQAGVYNNNSGNWRFADVSFSGTAVPEPTTIGLLAAGSLGLLARRRRTA